MQIAMALFLIGCARVPPFHGTDSCAVREHPQDIVVYRDLGSGDAPLTVLMAHGAMMSKVQWARAESRLKGRYRTINLDLPGHGESSKHLSWIEPFSRRRPPLHPY